MFKLPISSFLATSGVLAIVLGLALQSTLADVFSGLAINIESPLRAGDWITVSDHITGQVIEVNWRAMRLRTISNDTVVVPNSFVSKAIVTNHSRPTGRHFHIIRLLVDHAVLPAQVIETLLAAASGSSGIAPLATTTAYACEFSDTVIAYELSFAIDDFAMARRTKSEMLGRIATMFQDNGIAIGLPPTDIRMIPTPASVGGSAGCRVPASSEASCGLTVKGST